MSRVDEGPASREAIAGLRRERWRDQRAYVARRSPFFARLWAGRPVPERLEDLPELPLCDKAMLRESQAAHPPFGDYLAAVREFVIRLHRTSGTTGEAMNIAQTEADAAQTAEVGGRCFMAAGLTTGTLTVHCLNYRMWMGGVSDHLALEATGATVIPFGVGESQLLVRTILDLKVGVIHCTPSYPAALEQTIAEHFPGLAPRDLGLRLGLFGGEAGLDDPNFRGRLESVWGFTARNANYGVSDVFSNFASQCWADNDLHFLGEDVLHAELIEPESGDSVPWREGESGELVLTHLKREAQPLVRFRTNDVIAITGEGACACGREATRFRVLGRSDDMVVVRGVNVFPATVGGVIAGLGALSGEFRIRLKGRGPYDRLPVEAELAAGAEGSAALARDVEEAIKSRLRASAIVTLLPFASLPRTGGKTKRLIREE